MDPKVEQLLKLPNKQKIAILVAVVVLEAVALVYFLYLPKHKMLTELKAQHQQLQAEVDENTKIANNLPKIQKEYNDLNLELEKALTELPNSKEIPSLLTSIAGGISSFPFSSSNFTINAPASPTEAIFFSLAN